MASYKVEPNEDTLHGFFSRDLPPILTIDSGDTVHFTTLEAEWGLENFNVTTFDPKAGPTPRNLMARSKWDGPRGHALCGPIAIRGAEPGMTLAVKVENIRTGTWGWTVGGDEVTDGHVMHLWELDPDQLRGRNQHGHQVNLHPFMGVMGMPPPEEGQHSTQPPRLTGGNIDCKELGAGTTLYLPIAVPGGLFSTGDGHAAQGDGEVSRTAIECPIEDVELTFHLHPDLHLNTPRANTPAGWLTLGFDESLNIAAQTALSDMINLMAEKYNVTRADAKALASIVVDMRITQIANGVFGVHAVLPHGAIEI
ncbi:MAG: acetamidase/formamidase family protein [Chloroflexota bacterium]